MEIQKINLNELLEYNKHKLLKILNEFLGIYEPIKLSEFNKIIHPINIQAALGFEKENPEFVIRENGDCSTLSLISTITTLLCGEALVFITDEESDTVIGIEFKYDKVKDFMQNSNNIKVVRESNTDKSIKNIIEIVNSGIKRINTELICEHIDTMTMEKAVHIFLKNAYNNNIGVDWNKFISYELTQNQHHLILNATELSNYMFNDKTVILTELIENKNLFDVVPKNIQYIGINII